MMRQRVVTVLMVTIVWGLCCVDSPADANVRTKAMAYTHGSVELEGYLAWDDAARGRRPGVLVVHEWWGLNDYARSRAEQLAELGYVAFAVDMYGKGNVTTHPKQAAEWMTATTANVGNWRARALAGLNVLTQHPSVDPARLAAIGYCFGGATVTQLAYGEPVVNGVVSFHGSMPLPGPDGPASTSTKLLIAHGDADSFLTDEHIKKFRRALNRAGMDWQMIVYGGARHSFTNPQAGEFGMDALKYDPAADARSWQAMQQFFDEMFSRDR